MIIILKQKIVKSGFAQSVELLIKNGANVNSKSNYGETALLLAAYQGNSESEIDQNLCIETI